MARVLTLWSLLPGRRPIALSTHSMYLTRPLLPAGQFHASAIPRAGKPQASWSIKEVVIKMTVTDQHICRTLTPHGKGLRLRNFKQRST
jgi:hypothetical protein